VKKVTKKEKKEMKKEIIYWLVGIILFSAIFLGTIQFTSAAEQSDLGIIKQNSCFDLYQTCDDCSWVNLTSIKYPNGTIETFNLYMTKKNQNFNYTFCNTTLAGGYTYTVAGDKGGVYSTEVIEFTVSPSGTILSSAQSTTYILIFVISLLIFIGLIIVGLYLPAHNESDEMTGYILAVSNIKYVKFVCLGLAYGVAMLLAYLSWMLSFSFLPEMEFIATMFKFLFYTMAIVALPAFIFLIYLMIANWNRDTQISELLSRGLPTRG
jgi:hypothetical protein